jgi:Transposase, Mutator family
VFGGKALIQRCRRHKERNVTDHVPEAERRLLQRRLRVAWALTNFDEARAVKCPGFDGGRCSWTSRRAAAAAA